MKQRIFSIFSIILLTAAGLFMLADFPLQRTDITQAASSQGLREDPRGRVEFEFHRTRNPLTNQVPAGIKAKEAAFARTLPVKEQLIREGRLSKTSLLDWESAGPFNIGGRTRALGIDVDNTYMLAGGVSGAMYKSTDGGDTWINTSQPSSLHSATCISQDTRAGKTATWYYGTGEYSGNSANAGGGAYFNGDGIYKSTDHGSSWTRLGSTVSNTPHSFDSFFDYVWRIVTDPSNNAQDEVYAATYGTIQKSTNGGASWSIVLGGSSPYSNFTDIAVTSDGVLYATMNSDGGQKGIWRSTDGSTWTNITPAGWPASYRRVVLDIAPSNENIVYFLGCTPGFGKNDHSLWKYTYLSGDGSSAGGTWQNRSANLPASGGTTGDFDSQYGYDLVVKVKPDNENTVFIGGTVLYRSTDGFAGTSNTSRIGGYANDNYDMVTNHFCDQHSLAFVPGFPARLVSGHDGGISITVNCTAPTVSWTSLNNGYLTSQFYTLSLDQSGTFPNALLGGMQDNGTHGTRSGDGSAPWTRLLTGDGAFCAIANNGSTYYASTQNGVMYRFGMNSNGTYANWTRIDPMGSRVNNFINPFLVDPSDGDLIYMIGRDRIWRNSDVSAIPLYSNNQAAVNWQSFTNVAAEGDTLLTAIAVSSQNPANRIYYGTDEGYIYRIDNAHTGDPIPALVYTNPYGGYVSCLAVDPRNADRVLAVFSNYGIPSLYMTTNGGSSWSDVSGNLEEYSNGSGSGPSCRWAEIVYENNSPVYFVGTSTGLYSTNTLNGFSTWWAQEGGPVIGNVVVDMIAARESDGMIAAATHGKGVYKAYVSTSGLADDDAAAPDRFRLHPNYPNPFNPETHFSYELPAAADVTFSVYDLQGKTVKTLLRNNQPAGQYTLTWNGTDQQGRRVASGTYLYQLRAGSAVKSGKCILMK